MKSIWIAQDGSKKLNLMKGIVGRRSKYQTAAMQIITLQLLLQILFHPLGYINNIDVAIGNLSLGMLEYMNGE